MPHNRKFFARLGIKNTRSRNRVLTVLEKTISPMTAEDIYVHLKEHGNMINLSTVYRILDLFVGKGIVIKSISALNSKSMFEIAKKEHKHHIVCLHCKKTLYLENCPLKCYEEYLQTLTQYNITGHKLEIFGYCPECKILRNEN